MPEAMNRNIVERNPKVPPTFDPGNNYLLIIGIDNYANPIPTLNNAVRDAKAFRDVLQSEYKFFKKQTIELLNEDASRRNILKTFDQLLEKLTENDNLVVFFSGHGEFHDLTKRGFWLPADAAFEERYTYLSNSEVTDFFKNLKARHVFGIVDSCFSGALFRGRKKTAERLASLPSRWLLTAGRLEVVSDGPVGTHSPFMKSLIAQLKYSAPEGILWASEICDGVLDGVDSNTQNQTARGEPLQNVGHEGGQFVFFKKDVDAKSAAAEIQNIEIQGNRNRNTPKSSSPEPAEETSKAVNQPTTTLEATKSRLKSMLTDWDLRKVFHALDEIISESSNVHSTLILIKSRFSSNRRGEMTATLSPDQIRIEDAKITQALISIISDLREEDFKKGFL